LNRIYLDNAATSFPKPPVVWETLARFGRDVGAPAGRGSYGSAREVDLAIERARETIAKFFGARGEELAFTLNATDALNIAIFGSIRDGDHVVTSVVEHNSVRRPLEALKRAGRIELTVVGADDTGGISVDELSQAVTARTRLVAVQHASNVCGTLQPIDIAAEICRTNGAALLVDAAQTAGSHAIDVEAQGIDLLAAPGHKSLLGPPGTGVLVVSSSCKEKGIDIAPFRHGGTGTDSDSAVQPSELPTRLEAGSPNVPGLVALAAAIEWIEERGLESVASTLRELGSRFEEGVRRIDGIRLPGPTEGVERKAVYSVVTDEIAPDELAAILDASFHVEVRSGLHCAPEAHQALGTHPSGTVRFSPGIFTTTEEIDAAIEALADSLG